MSNIFNLNILAQGEAVVVSESVDTAAEEVQEIVSLDGTPVDVNDPNSVGGKQSAFNPQMIFLILMVVVIYFFIFRGPKKKQKQHKQMVQSLEKNTKVRTIGGIIGTIVEVRDNEVVLKIDENNNTKIKIIKGAIATTIADDIEK